MGVIKSGFNCQNDERYTSQARQVYTGQMQQKVFGTGGQTGGQGSGAITLDFQSAKKLADSRRQ